MSKCKSSSILSTLVRIDQFLPHDTILFLTYHSRDRRVLNGRLLHCCTCGGHISHWLSIIVSLLHVLHGVFRVISAARGSLSRHGVRVFRLLHGARTVPLHGQVRNAWSQLVVQIGNVHQYRFLVRTITNNILWTEKKRINPWRLGRTRKKMGAEPNLPWHADN